MTEYVQRSLTHYLIGIRSPRSKAETVSHDILCNCLETVIRPQVDPCPIIGGSQHPQPSNSGEALDFVGNKSRLIYINSEDMGWT